MKWKIKDMRAFLRLISTSILLVGLTCAVYIYWTAGDDMNGVLGYEMIGGSVYPVMPQDSKMYRHDLELYGGKAAVLADDLSRWVAGLWHGKSLAFIVACVAIVGSFGFFYAANHLPTRLKSGVRGENNRERSD